MPIEQYKIDKKDLESYNRASIEYLHSDKKTSLAN